MFSLYWEQPEKMELHYKKKYENGRNLFYWYFFFLLELFSKMDYDAVLEERWRNTSFSKEGNFTTG